MTTAKKRVLVDSSTILLLLKHASETRLADLADEIATLDLAGYEAGNGIWKQVCLLKLISEDDARKTHQALIKLLSHISMMTEESFDRVKAMEIAVKARITYYDACYILAADSLGTPLATDDRKLAGASAGRKVIGWKDLDSDDELSPEKTDDLSG